MLQNCQTDITGGYIEFSQESSFHGRLDRIRKWVGLGLSGFVTGICWSIMPLRTAIAPGKWQSIKRRGCRQRPGPPEQAVDHPSAVRAAAGSEARSPHYRRRRESAAD